MLDLRGKTDSNEVFWVPDSVGQSSSSFLESARGMVRNYWWFRSGKITAIQKEGAELILSGSSYGQAVDAAFASITTDNELLIGDTARDPGERSPRYVSTGYSTIVRELPKTSACIDAVFVRVGVDGLASAVIRYFVMNSPKTRSSVLNHSTPNSVFRGTGSGVPFTRSFRITRLF